MDQYASEHAYPRTTDPAHTSLYPTAVTSNNITLNVGVSTRVEYICTDYINHWCYDNAVTIHGITMCWCS